MSFKSLKEEKTDYLVGKLTIKILNLFLGAKNQISMILRSYPPFRKERWYAFHG